jgi:hypothetical protein
MKKAHLVELICGLAAGAWGLLALAFFLFGPSYTGGSSGQTCSANPDGTTTCTTHPETIFHASALQLGLSPDARFWLSLMMLVLGAIAVSAMLHSRTGSATLRGILVACTSLLCFLTCLGIFSVGLFLLPSLALAIIASVAAFRTEQLIVA